MAVFDQTNVQNVNANGNRNVAVNFDQMNVNVQNVNANGRLKLILARMRMVVNSNGKS
jgi:hypothetical protein